MARGARVIGTASAPNHEFVRALGGEPVTYGEGLVDRVRAVAPGGVDAAMDFVGGDAIEVSRAVLWRPDRLASIVDPAVVAAGGRNVWARPDTAGLDELARLADAGSLRSHVQHALPLQDAAQAWRLNESGRTRGKIVLMV